MRKLILFFLLFLLIAGMVTLTYGFWNGKKIRDFSKEAAKLKSESGLDSRLGEIESDYMKAGGKDAAEFEAELAEFTSKLDEIAGTSDEAGTEAEKIDAPHAAKPTKQNLVELFIEINQQSKELKSIVEFSSKVFGVATSLSTIDSEMSLEDMKSILAEADAKADGVKTDAIPGQMRGAAENLKNALANYLVKLNEIASLSEVSADEINGAYADFSQKENDYRISAKNYINSFQNLGLMSSEADSELKMLGSIKFNLR